LYIGQKDNSTCFRKTHDFFSNSNTPYIRMYVSSKTCINIFMDVGVVVSVETCKLFPFVAMMKNRLHKHEALNKNLITMCMSPNLKDTDPIGGAKPR